MRSAIAALLLAAALCAASCSRPPTVAAAFADPAREASDRAQDAHRQGPALLQFAGVKSGDKVMDLIPGAGYFTRAFSRVVGPRGHVYAMWPSSTPSNRCRRSMT